VYKDGGANPPQRFKGDLIMDKIVEYIDHMGTDSSVVDAARVSFDKVSTLYTKEQNNKLIKYLAKHNHWSPFAHTSIKMKFKAPVFIARQLAKHQVGFAWNEISRRYIDYTPECWIPDAFRFKAENKKQGSSDQIVQDPELLVQYKNMCSASILMYEHLLEKGVCPEQARSVLPQSMYTEWIWTGSLYAWSRMYLLRSHDTAQQEVRDYAKAVSNVCYNLFPLSWSALTNESMDRTIS
jgi:thymidylate synthase (FAD)